MKIKIICILVLGTLFLALACLSQAEQRLNQGNKYFDEGKYNEAIREYTKAIEADPNLVEPYTNRASAYVEVGEFDKAIADNTKAIELDPENVIPYYNRSMAYARKGEFDKVIADCNKILDDFKFYNNWVFYTRALAYAEKNQYDKALTDLQKAKENSSTPEFLQRVDNKIKELTDAMKKAGGK